MSGVTLKQTRVPLRKMLIQIEKVDHFKVEKLDRLIYWNTKQASCFPRQITQNSLNIVRNAYNITFSAIT